MLLWMKLSLLLFNLFYASLELLHTQSYIFAWLLKYMVWRQPNSAHVLQKEDIVNNIIDISLVAMFTIALK